MSNFTESEQAYFKRENEKTIQREDNYEEEKQIAEIIHDRLTILLRENKLSQVKFFDEIKVMQESSNASKIFKINSTGSKRIYLLYKVAKRFNVSVNWLIGELPIDVREDKHKNINNYIGLTDESIDTLHRLKIGDLQENEFLGNSAYPQYLPYIDMINAFIENNRFTNLINDLRLIQLNSKNNPMIKEEYDMEIDGKTIKLTEILAREYLIQKACNDFKKIIEEICN